MNRLEKLKIGLKRDPGSTIVRVVKFMLSQLKKIIENEALSFAVASIDNHEIDSINILRASFKAMHLALEKLKKKPGLLLIDGNRFYPYKKIPYQCIVKGDAIYSSIAAASILAKTYRDEWMQQLHNDYPYYNWMQNKGYGTKEHRDAIKKWGHCEYHRRSFRLKELQERLF